MASTSNIICNNSNVASTQFSECAWRRIALRTTIKNNLNYYLVVFMREVNYGIYRQESIGFCTRETKISSDTLTGSQSKVLLTMTTYLPSSFIANLVIEDRSEVNASFSLP